MHFNEGYPQHIQEEKAARAVEAAYNKGLGVPPLKYKHCRDIPCVGPQLYLSPYIVLPDVDRGP
eukprot:12402757-Karenia_brevis.AAC.1